MICIVHILILSAKYSGESKCYYFKYSAQLAEQCLQVYNMALKHTAEPVFSDTPVFFEESALEGRASFKASTAQKFCCVDEPRHNRQEWLHI